LVLLGSASLHGVNANKQGLRRKLATNDCIIMAVEALSISGEDPEMIIECEVHPDDANGIGGISLSIDASPAQLNKLKALIKSGQVAAGYDSLDIAGSDIDDKAVHLPPGRDISDMVRQNEKKVGRRRLVATSGNLKMLLVKVTDVNGLKLSDSPTHMSDEVFGTGVDPNNLKSALRECSWDQAIVTLPSAGTNQMAAEGVIEVSIGISLTDNSRGIIRNAVTTAVQNKLGYSLPGPYDYVLYALEKCYLDCGWAAYAYVNSWNSVYQSGYYKQPGVLVHELGHNFGLAHSGGTDGLTYTDHTCAMGNPHYSDEGFQCFNPAKNFQLDWYNPAKITEDPVAGYTKTLTLVGIGEYDKAVIGGYPVTVKLETGTGADYFVGFNRATGPNRLNDQGDNQVNIIQVNGNNGFSYSQSYLRALLSEGQSHNLSIYGKTVTVTVDSIDITTSPGLAVVTITDNTAPVNPPTPNPTAFPTNPIPTPNPTNAPTAFPTNPPPTPNPTNLPTPNPTAFPTFPPPTNPPTPAPTAPPTVPTITKYVCAKNQPIDATICADGSTAGGSCSDENVNNSCGRKGVTCWWAACPGDGGGPPPSPTPPAPTPPAPTGGCPVCSITGEACCNTCVDWGNPRNRGCNVV
jgi:hypothetical protein